MDEILEALKKAFLEHAFAVVGSALFFVIGTQFGKWWGYWQWRSRKFNNRVNFSLNIIDGTTLRLRTLREDTVAEVFHHPSAIDLLLAASKKTTEQDPLLPLPKDEAWYVLNSVLNSASEQFADGYVYRDMGLPIYTERYLVALTYEKGEQLRQQKFRALFLKVSDVPKLDQVTDYESPIHQMRLATLRQIIRAATERPHLVRELELTLPARG